MPSDGSSSVAYDIQGITRTVATAALKTKKNSPHIFFGAGVAAVIGGTYLACRATLKPSEVVDETSDDIEEVKSLNERYLS